GTTVPAELVPSPQLIVAVNSLPLDSLFASVMVATLPVNGVPSIGVMLIPTAEIGTSPTVAWDVATAVAPPSSTMVVCIVNTPDDAWAVAPLLWDPPPGATATVPELFVPSPQSIVAV